MVAWATCWPEGGAPLGKADLLEHHAITADIAANADGVLPARFPTWFADEEVLRAELGRRQSDLIDALERVRGRAEIAVTALWIAPSAERPESPLAAATPGRTYMLARQQAFGGSDRRRARARELADQIDRLVGHNLVDVRHQLCPSVTVALSSALLVPRESAETITNDLIRAEQDVRILVNGPWPPYTFATVV